MDDERRGGAEADRYSDDPEVDAAVRREDVATLRRLGRKGNKEARQYYKLISALQRIPYNKELVGKMIEHSEGEIGSVNESDQKWFTLLHELFQRDMPPADVLAFSDEQAELLGSLEEGANAREQILDLVNVYARGVQLLRDRLDSTVAVARTGGIGWTAIGRAAGITPQAAARRWDAEAKQRNAAYKRSRRGK